MPLAAQTQSRDLATQFSHNFLAGGISAIMSKTCTAPIERVKLLLQTQSINKEITRPYKGVIDCVTRVCKEQGFASLWRGNLANVYRYFPNHAVTFAFKDFYRNLFVGDSNKQHNPTRFFLASFASGGAAGGTALFVGYPLDVARTMLAVDVAASRQNRRFLGTWSCIRHICASEGIGALYRGFGIAFFGVVLFKGLFLGGYDCLKSLLSLQQTANESKTYNLVKRFAVAQALTTTVGTFCYPIDTVRRRLMMQSRKDNGSLRYAGALDCIGSILREEGMRTFMMKLLSFICTWNSRGAFFASISFSMHFPVSKLLNYHCFI
jgi:solute carrier family 25 (adenine nucleotide translocator) protein 4/5/6/31